MIRILVLLLVLTAATAYPAIENPAAGNGPPTTPLELLFVLDGPGRAAVAAALAEECTWARDSGEHARLAVLEALRVAWLRDNGRIAATLVRRVRLTGVFSAWHAGEACEPVAHPDGKAWRYRGRLPLRQTRVPYQFVVELLLPERPADPVELRINDPRAAAFDEDEFGDRVSVLLVDPADVVLIDAGEANTAARAFFKEMQALYAASAVALEAAGNGREAAAAWRAHVAAFRALEARGRELEERYGPLEDLPDAAGLVELSVALETALSRFTALLEAAMVRYADDADFRQAVRDLEEEASCDIP